MPSRPSHSDGAVYRLSHLCHHRNSLSTGEWVVETGTTRLRFKIPGARNRWGGSGTVQSGTWFCSEPRRGFGTHLGVLRPLGAPSTSRPGGLGVARASPRVGGGEGRDPAQWAAGGRRKWALVGVKAISITSRQIPSGGKQLPIYK